MKKIFFYIILFIVYLVIIEFTSRTLVFFKTKNPNIFLFGFNKNVEFEISDLSDLQFNVKKLNKTVKIKKNIKNKDGVFTIWTYGASLTYGYSCGNESSSWPIELEAINKKIKIINFAIPGIYSDYSIKKLEYNLTANILKKPDMIIWSHRDEEKLSIYNGIKRNKNKINKNYEAKKIKYTSHLILRVIKTAENKLVFFKVMNFGYHKINDTAKKLRSSIKPTDNDHKIAIENFKWNTLDAINIAEEYDISEFLILSLFSHEFMNMKPSELPVFYKEYLKTARSLSNLDKVAFIDLTRYLSNKKKEDIDKYYCEHHFNLRGNKLIAEIINDYILQK